MVKAKLKGKKNRHKRIYRITKSIRYFIGRRALRVFFSIPHLMPLSWALSFANIIAGVGFHFPGGYRRQALLNLKLFLEKEKSFSELRSIAKEIGIEATKGVIESVYSVSHRKEEVYSAVTLEGREYLDTALRQKKGVIALTAHFGNFAIMGGKLNSEGYPFHLVLKLPKDPGIGQYFKLKMEQHGIKFILAEPTIVSRKYILRCLRRNEIVGLIADGDQKVRGVPVNLMGQEIAMPPGPAILARRTGAPILPMFIIRQPDNSQTIIIEPPIEIMGEKETRSVSLLTTQFAKIIESYIRRYPTQWYWVNKKHRHAWYRKEPKKIPSSDNLSPQENLLTAP